MTEDLKLAIQLVDKLFNERDGAEWWAANIEDASKHLTDPSDWTRFYSYMANPEQFDPNAQLQTIEDSMDIDYQYPSHMKEVVYKNGSDTIIHVKNMLENMDVDDEKTF